MPSLKTLRHGKSRISVTTRGALFDEGKPKQVVTEFLEESRQEVAQRGLALLKDRMGATFKHPKGHYEAQVVLDKREDDVLITDHFVIYGSWLEGTSTRNRSTRFKGYQNFRKVRLQLRKVWKEVAQQNLDKALEKLQ
jgi:hypothetical protein